MPVITVKEFDGVTPFNEIPVQEVNRAWGNKAYVLVYADGVFTGFAQPKGNKTLEEWQEYFQSMYE